MSKNNKYDGNLKFEAVKLKKKGIPISTIMEVLNIRNPSQIYQWLKIFDEKGSRMAKKVNREETRYQIRKKQQTYISENKKNFDFFSNKNNRYF